jgi:hypothetical protein
MEPWPSRANSHRDCPQYPQPVTLPADKDHRAFDIVQAKRPRDMTSEAARELVSCWVAVANDGGAVGFAFPPVDVNDVAPAWPDG